MYMYIYTCTTNFLELVYATYMYMYMYMYVDSLHCDEIFLLQTSKVRPFVVAAILRNITFTPVCIYMYIHAHVHVHVHVYTCRTSLIRTHTA